MASVVVLENELNQNNEAIINFGKHKGQLVTDVSKRTDNIWIQRGDFLKTPNVFHQNLQELK